MNLSEIRLNWGIGAFHGFAFRNDDVESDLPACPDPLAKKFSFAKG